MAMPSKIQKACFIIRLFLWFFWPNEFIDALCFHWWTGFGCEALRPISCSYCLGFCFGLLVPLSTYFYHVCVDTIERAAQLCVGQRQRPVVLLGDLRGMATNDCRDVRRELPGDVRGDRGSQSLPELRARIHFGILQQSQQARGVRIESMSST